MVGIIIRALAAVGVLMFAGIRVDARVDELESWYSYLEYVCEQNAILSGTGAANHRDRE